MPLAIAILATLIGTTLAARGIRVRRFADDAPRCRRCGYDLRATTGDRCPECGATLDAPRAIARGRRRVRRRLLAVGVVALLLGGATIGLDRGGLLTERSLDRLTPTSYLLWRADRDRGPALEATVWRLLWRQHRERDSVSDAQRQRMLARLVAIHGDASLPWLNDWNEVIEKAYDDGSLPPALTKIYVEHLAESVTATLDPPTLEVGGLYRPDFAIVDARRRGLSGGTMFGGGRAPFWTATNLRYLLRLDGEIVGNSSRSLANEYGFVFSMSKPGKFQPFPIKHRVQLDFATRHATGPCELEIEMRFDILDASRRDRGTLGTKVVTVRVPVTLLPASTTRPAGDD